ncbi:3'-hydroxy-N-methyl-(S)-coclaurine 4'-O-methyltransferase-like [Aristolochia californica]|uniref:3'-hydroxy-N-methyl-(S)-coclaurine 4'-O-methyltransferase-like n=1 Tax=Aristolochia californica TaxID=171875 RepID=UPI0035E02195
MNLKGKEDVGEVEAQAQLWKYIYGFAETLVLRCAVEMSLADIINNNGGPISLPQLASGLPFPEANPDALYRVMRFLVHLKIFNEQENQSGEKLYGLEPAGKLLLRDAEKTMAPIILGGAHKDFTLPWHNMKDGLTKDGATAFEKTMGMTLWDYLAGDPSRSKMFNEVMACETKLLTSSLVQGCYQMFKGLESIVDVGGGNGTTIKAISKAFPHLKCTVFDLPHVISGSPEIPGVDRVPGDVFESVPAAQAILLKLVLHDWSDEDCVKILSRCKEAVPRNGGKVIIVDVVSDAEAEHPFSKPRMVLDIDMLVFTGGRERTEEDWKRLLLKAGYRGCQIRHIEAIQSVIEAYPY